MRPGEGAGPWETFYPLLGNISPFEQPRGGGEELSPSHHPRGTREPCCVSAPRQFPSISVSYNRNLCSINSPLVLGTGQCHGRSCPWGRPRCGARGAGEANPDGAAAASGRACPSPRRLPPHTGTCPLRARCAHTRGFSSGEPQVCERIHISAYSLKLPIRGLV